MKGNQMNKAKLQALRRTAIFCSLAPEHLELVQRVTDRVLVPQGTRLARQGAIATHMSIIVEGTASVFLDDEFVASLGANDMIGEFAMVDDFCASATVIADTEMIIWHIGRRGFTPVWAQNPEMSAAMLEGVVSKLRDANLTVADALQINSINLLPG